MAQTPASWPSLADQLKREGIELRDRGDTTNAVGRLQEALDSEPNNAAVLAELAKTYDLMELYDRANEVWRKLQEMGPSAGPAYELADRRLKLGRCRRRQILHRVRKALRQPLPILQSTPQRYANMRLTRSHHCPLPLHRKYLLLQLA